jgi:hypothetical protein
MFKPPEIRRELNLRKRLLKCCKIIKSVEQLLIIKKLDRKIKSTTRLKRTRTLEEQSSQRISDPYGML